MRLSHLLLKAIPLKVTKLLVIGAVAPIALTLGATAAVANSIATVFAYAVDNSFTRVCVTLSAPSGMPRMRVADSRGYIVLNQGLVLNSYDRQCFALSYYQPPGERLHIDYYDGRRMLSHVSTTVYMGPGSYLAPGGSYWSPSRKYHLEMQTDGNLVIYTAGGKAIRATMTLGTRAATSFQFQRSDGNLVAYGNSGAVWSPYTQNKGGSFLVMQDDGNLVLYNYSFGAIWASEMRNSGMVRIP
jgi:hypothetical protein